MAVFIESDGMSRDPTWSAGQRHTKGRTQQRRQRPFEKNAISQTRNDDSQAMPTHAALGFCKFRGGIFRVAMVIRRMQF